MLPRPTTPKRTLSMSTSSRSRNVNRSQRVCQSFTGIRLLMDGNANRIENENFWGGSVFFGNEIAQQIRADRRALGGDAVHGRVYDAKLRVGKPIGELVSHLGGGEIILRAPDDQAGWFDFRVARDDLLLDLP